MSDYIEYLIEDILRHIDKGRYAAAIELLAEIIQLENE